MNLEAASGKMTGHRAVGMLLICVLFVGCSSWLPSAKRDTITTWNSYDEARTFSILKNNKCKAIRFSTLNALCRVLDCSPGDLLEYSRED